MIVGASCRCASVHGNAKTTGEFEEGDKVTAGPAASDVDMEDTSTEGTAAAAAADQPAPSAPSGATSEAAVMDMDVDEDVDVDVTAEGGLGEHQPAGHPQASVPSTADNNGQGFGTAASTVAEAPPPEQVDQAGDGNKDEQAAEN